MSLRHVLSATLLATLLASAGAAHAEQKIAVIDPRRAAFETEDGLRAQATIKKLFDNRQREIDQKQQELAKEHDELEKQKSSLSKEALAKRTTKWQAEMLKVQADFIAYNRELEQKQQTLYQPIHQKVTDLVKKAAIDGGYDLVIDRQSVPYVRTEFDLTDKIITAYNKK